MAKNTLLRVALPLAAAAMLTAALLPGSGSARAQTAPANTAEPKITGDAIDNHVLTATPGTWSGTTPMSFAYRWLRCPVDGGAANGSDCTQIGSATASTYRVRNADVGLRIRVRVTATNTDGSASAASNPTPIVQGSAKPQNTSLPTIAGSPVVGETLTANPGTWSGSAPITYTYQWRRCDRNGNSCSAISGATGRTYATRQPDVGASLRVRVTARNSVGTDAATSAPTAVIVAGAPTGCPAGNGVIHVDQLTPPARLLIDRFQVTPSPIPRSAGGFVVRFHVSACGGRSVAGAIVYATAVPYNQFAIPPEQPTGEDGSVTLSMSRLKGFPAAKNQTLVVMFVRARKGGEPLLGGISNRRLVSVRLAK